MNETYSSTKVVTIGSFIRKERMIRGWSQSNLVDKLYELHNAVQYEQAKSSSTNCRRKREIAPNEGTVGRWERGVQIPSHHYRRLLCQVFQISEKEFEQFLQDSILG